MKPLQNCLRKAIALLCATTLFTTARAQQNAVPDSNFYGTRKQVHYQAFMKGDAPFAPAPRNRWELGVKAGSVSLLTDVDADFLRMGYGLHLRKALGYLFSMRLSYHYGVAEGIGTDRKRNHQFNPAWQGYEGRNVFYNYQTTLNDLALEGVFTIDNLRFHKADRAVRVYVLAGVGVATYQARVNKLDAQGRLYNFRPVLDNLGTKDKRTVRSELKALLDDSYETAAENDGLKRPKLFGSTAAFTGHLGAGLSFRLSNRINLALENRVSLTRSDLLDGNQWEEDIIGQPTLTRSNDAFNYLTAGLNFNLGKNATAPLWWINPLGYGYGELRNPQLMRLPKPFLPDADGDGITDQFDLEQTPAGVPVDHRGVSRDTDGDGVPDAIDKELITPTHCQPVNKDGVGKCPCPEDCSSTK